ncbi:lysophospholipid acyltransferase family protein [Raineya sp.]|jgi:1-acyl-sn-glycerol-3-phosphate acyltransferase
MTSLSDALEYENTADHSLSQKIIAWGLTAIQLLVFLLIILVFHPLHVIFSLFGYKSYMLISHAMMGLVWRSTLLIGTKTRLEGLEVLQNLPENTPIIVVSNHQSEYEIACLGYLFSKTSHHLKYIAKKELAYWIPSVSWNIRYGGHGVIDRSQKVNALKSIEDFAWKVKKNNWAAYIYPEGTRNRYSNEVRPFKTAGFAKLCEILPEAPIIPIALENFWTVKRMPIEPFATMRVKIFPPLWQKDFPNAESLLQHCENMIRKELANS